MTDLSEKLAEAQKQVADIQNEITKQASQSLIDAVTTAYEEAKLLIENGNDIHEEVKNKVKELVKVVWGSPYGVRKPPARAFDWAAFVKELKDAGITSKNKSISKSAIEETVEKMPKDSQWNRLKDEYLNSDGKGTKKTYWAK